MDNIEILPYHYVLSCHYYWGGEVKVPLLIKTDVDLKKMIQTNLNQYIGFVQQHLAPLFDFASYSKNSKIVEIAEFRVEDYDPATDFDQFATEAIQQLSKHDIENVLERNQIKIEVNKNQPSSFDSFLEITEEQYNNMKNFIQFHSVAV